MARPPVWFLDVDGVVSPLRLPAPAAGYRSVLAGWAGEMLYRPDVLARIQALHESGALEVRWLTTWEDLANTVLAPLVGLGPFQVHRPSNVADGTVAGWWKARVVHDFLATTERSAVWADDEITKRFDPHGDYGFDPLACNPVRDYSDRLLAVCPPTQSGLSATDLDRIELFAQRPGVRHPSRESA